MGGSKYVWMKAAHHTPATFCSPQQSAQNTDKPLAAQTYSQVSMTSRLLRPPTFQAATSSSRPAPWRAQITSQVPTCSDQHAAKPFHEDLQARGHDLEETYVDTGYVSGENIIEAEQEG